MFRVLTEEESRSVKRWQAPALNAADPSLKVVSHSNSRQSSAAENAGDADAKDEIQDNIKHDTRSDSPVESDSSVELDNESAEKTSIEDTSSNVAATANISADMLQSSYDEGYSAGFAEGNAAAYESDNQGLSKVLKSLSEQEVLRNEMLLDDIIELVKVTTGLLLKKEIKTDASILKDWVVEGLSRLPTMSTTSTVHMHPLDADRVKQLVDPGLAERIVEDSKLNRGDCHIENGASTVRAGVYEQICRLTSNQTSTQTSDDHSEVQDA